MIDLVLIRMMSGCLNHGESDLHLLDISLVLP